jgi:hypothetical protein
MSSPEIPSNLGIQDNDDQCFPVQVSKHWEQYKHYIILYLLYFNPSSNKASPTKGHLSYKVCSVIGVIYIYLCLPNDNNNNKCLIVFQVYLDPQCIPTLVLVSFLLVFMDQTFHKCNGK